MSLPKGVSQRDIANHLGVSVSTVSRALSGNSRVSVLTRTAVTEAIEQLSHSAHIPASDIPVMIGITHSHSSDGMKDHQNESVLDQVLGGAEVACRQNNVVPYPWQQSHLLSSDESKPFYRRVSAIIMSGGEVDKAVVESIRANDKPIVIIGGHLAGSSIPSVAADSFNGMYLATRHLLDLGHEHIGFINGPDTTYTSREKKAGYLTALAEASVPFDPESVIARNDRTGFSDEVSEELTRSLLGRDERPTALIYATDAMARAGYRVCQEFGLAIPDDISIVGFHDDDAEFAYPPMTSVRVNRFDWGFAAIEELMRILRGEQARDSRLLLPVELIVRASTGASSKLSRSERASREDSRHG